MAFVPLYAPLPKLSQRALALYISLAYGGPHLPRAIPVYLAAKYQLATQEEISWEIDESYKQRVMAYCERMRRETDAEQTAQYRDAHERVTKKIFTWKRRQGAFEFSLRTTRGLYSLLQDRAVRTLLTPYFFATFAPPWYYDTRISLPHRSDNDAPPDEREGAVEFIRRYGEGAWITFSLLLAGLNGRTWNSQITTGTDPLSGVDDIRRIYPNRYMLEIPAIAGKEPFEVWRLIKQLNALLIEYGKKTGRPDVGGWHLHGEYFHNPWNISLLLKFDPDGSYQINDPIVRSEVVLLIEVLQKRGENAQPGNWWSTLDEDARNYLIFRACDLVTYGPIVADRTFPQPTLPGIPPQQISLAVTALMMLLLKAQEEVKAHREQSWVRRKEEFFEEVWWNKEGLLHYSLIQEVRGLNTYEVVASYLPPRLLEVAESERVKDACLQELRHSDGETPVDSAHGALEALEAFVQFCRLLRLPVNHVRDQTAQYGEREVNTYSTQEMINQMAQELVNLPRYTEYATLMQEQAGVQVVRKAKITTDELPKVPPGRLAEANRIARQNAIDAGILKPRRAIEAETRRRQDRWRRRAVGKPPPSEEPPPTQIRGSKPPEPEEPPRKRLKNTALKAAKRPQSSRKRGK